MDTTIVNVALNDMKGNLGATTSEVGWVITAYAIGNVIIVPMTSWLSHNLAGVIILPHLLYCLRSVLFYAVMQQVYGNWLFSGFYREWAVAHYWLLRKRSLPKVIRLKKEAWRRLFMEWVLLLVLHWARHWVDISLTCRWPYIFYINIPLGIIATLLTLSL